MHTEATGLTAGSETPPPEDSLDCRLYDLGDEYEVASADAPCEPPLGGDFHAAFPLEDGSVALVMGDVVGHGAEAAERAGVLCRAIGSCLIEGMPPGEALGFVNAAAEMNPEFEGFATAFAGTLAPKTGILTYANGGHEPPLVAERPPLFGFSRSSSRRRRHPENTLRELATTGPPLGVIGADETHYSDRTAHIEGGETLLLYTDGISEARRGRKMLGPDGLRRAFARWQFLRPLPLVRKMVGFARAFAGQGRRLRDDAALMALRRRQAPASSQAAR